MIITFLLLGLGFLCGGAAAIVDGLPYMVLERGFTQVIIGTVVAAAGVVMLALSWVLVELRRLKTTLSNAAMAMSVASMIGAPEATESPQTLSGTVDPAAGPVSGQDVSGPAVLSPADLGPAVLGAGALAGAGAALAAMQVPASPVPASPVTSDADAPQEPAGERVEPDFFGDLPAGDTEAVAARDLDVDALPVFDPFRPVDPRGEAGFEPGHESRSEPPSEAELLPVPFEAPQQRTDAPHEDETPVAASAAVIAAEAPIASDIADPLTPDVAPDAARETDEFGLLRESLAGLGLGPDRTDGRVEPSFEDVYRRQESAAREDSERQEDLAQAASWMEPASPRRAPWFDEAPSAGHELPAPLAEVEPEPVPETSWPQRDALQPAIPPWPPHAREAVDFEPASPLAPVQGVDDTADETNVAETAASLEPDVIVPTDPDTKLAKDAAAPDASDEGIIGAYQVGEAHFTIYADGSIQARTPDGDYSFTSMDELKIYLASEKSRLGV